MPFTPLHLGPAAVLKAIAGRRFSFMVFGGSQVLIDIEPLLGLIYGWERLHGPSHSLAGATIIGLVAGLTGKPVSNAVLRWLSIPHQSITWKVSFISAFIGTYSHVLLDALMHGDMTPWFPLADDNPLLGLISHEMLSLGCLATAVIGAMAWIIRSYVVGGDSQSE